MDKEIDKQLDYQNSLLLKIYSSQVLILAKKRISELPEDLKKESSLENSIYKIIEEIDITKECIKNSWR